MSDNKKAPVQTITKPGGETVKAVERRWVGAGVIKFNGNAMKYGEVGLVPASTAAAYPKHLIDPDAEWDGSEEAKEKSEAAAAAEAEALLERDTKEGTDVPAISGDEGAQGRDPAAEAGE